MSRNPKRQRIQQDLFQPRPTRPTLRTMPTQVQQKTVRLITELLVTSRNSQPDEKEACDE